jgi:hypothetical protein
MERFRIHRFFLDDAAWRDRMSFYFPTARAYPDRSGTWQRCADVAAGC